MTRASTLQYWSEVVITAYRSGDQIRHIQCEFSAYVGLSTGFFCLLILSIDVIVGLIVS